MQKEKIRLLDKTQMDNLSAIANAKDEGLKQGKQEGLAEGVAKGKLENQIQIALNMKHQNFDDHTIAKCLNISTDELNNLLNS